MRSSPSKPADATRDSRRIARIATLPYAHRGLHGPGRIENSRAAFEAAIALGHGIELDVQASCEGDAFVFHDDQLDRLTEMSGPVGELRAAELQRIPFRGSDETIPSLPEILHLVRSRVPILIEIKVRGGDVGRLCLSVFGALDAYAGPVAVMSFNPEVARWFSIHAPAVTRGLVVSEAGKRGLRGRVERQLALWRARPDFLAYDVRDLPSPFAARARSRSLPVLTWTVRTDADAATAKAHADQVIYESPAR